MSTKTVVPPNNIELWGFIPQMVSMHNPQPLWKQIDDNYAHGGGWRTQDGWKFTIMGREAWAEYPGDPRMTSRDHIQIGDEHLYLFDYSYVLWTDGDNMKMARID